LIVFRARPRVAVHFPEQLLRGEGCEYPRLRKGLAELRHVRHVRGEAKLDLAVVGGEHDIARLSHEGVADAAADLGADRMFWRLGSCRGSGRSARRQAVAGVDAPGLRLICCAGVG
jgi:hypothetical protein